MFIISNNIIDITYINNNNNNNDHNNLPSQS